HPGQDEAAAQDDDDQDNDPDDQRRLRLLLDRWRRGAVGILLVRLVAALVRRWRTPAGRGLRVVRLLVALVRVALIAVAGILVRRLAVAGLGVAPLVGITLTAGAGIT